ncbi:hypothetical protein GMOD_00000450 [Pyrenophora seminiperda CCB06]|uniref:Uncharacterized protein n=1 Tax=Pyrenophora seminiperda CCB06 TaxID=1302712 RepID=A0A3M7M7A1_9PLEO|nr:hypothetical protein GMOD_00000450 [Pyrenophora seminiperda CCB06]
MQHHQRPSHRLSLACPIDSPPASPNDPHDTEEGDYNKPLRSHRDHLKRIEYQSDFRGKKRNAKNTNLEVQLLEAKRKRLLAQQDWAGIDPSKPVSLQFLSSKEKDKIGKRRRTSRSHHATIGRKQNNEFGRGQPHVAGEASARALKGSAIRSHTKDIKIRIGAVASTNTYSAQTDKHAQSHASSDSDSMLFNQESPPTLQHSEKLDSASPVNSQSHTALNTSEKPSDSVFAPLTCESSQHCHVNWHQGRPPDQDASEQGMLACSPLELHAQHAAVGPEGAAEKFTPEYRLTHCGHGNARSLRLVFGGSAGGRTHIAPGNHKIGETHGFDESDLAPMSQTEHVHQTNIAMEQSYAEEALAGPTIVDEESWKRYLAIFDGTASHSDTVAQPRTSTLQYTPTARYDSEAAANWSHNATASRGDGSCANPSSISASLPSVKRGVRNGISAHAFDMGASCSGVLDERTLQTLDDGERSWRAFVFGSDDQSSVQPASDVTRGGFPGYSENASSMYLRLSGAVSSVNTGPVNAEARFASYTSHDAQKLALPAPPRSRNARSPAFHGCIELSDGEQKAVETEDMASERRSAKHATLANNASCDVVSSRVMDGTTTSRSTDTLEQLTRARAPCYPSGTTSSGGRDTIQNFRGSCSSCDSPASDYEALDVVDPNKR